ncbi:MAG TPA: hypothetical protein VMR37_06160 [Rhabdochlamydiaceae bacterium]|nr:hypothetical protein [Rhabdochlamydiaceae bacterium]
MKIEAYAGSKSSFLSRALSPLKSLDWKVYAIFAVAIGAVALIAISQMIPRTTPKIMETTLAHLGFKIEILSQTGFTQGRQVTFSDVCDQTLEAMKEVATSVKGPTIILGIMNVNILDLLELGLPPGKTYETASPTERAQSWVHQVLARLQEKGRIKSFEYRRLRLGSEITIKLSY